MKDHVKIGHLTKYDACRVNKDQVMDLETWFKIHTGVSNFDTTSPKTIQTLKTFMISVILFKMGKQRFLSQLLSNCRYLTGFYSCHRETDKNKIRVYMVLGDAFSKLETFVWILNRISRFITWPPFTQKASYLVK